MDKLIKKGAIFGGMWGLITGVQYAWGVFASSFAESDWSDLFSQTNILYKIAFLPSSLTHQILILWENQINSFLASLLVPYGPIVWITTFSIIFVGIPILIGFIIGVSVAVIILKVKGTRNIKS